MKLCQEGIDNLRCAIVELAAKDYLDYKQKLHKIDKYDRVYNGYDRDYFVYQLESVVNFFKSKWYTMLCSVDSAWLIAKLDEEFEEWKANYDRRKKKGG